MFAFDYSVMKDLENIMRVAQIFFVTTLDKVDALESGNNKAEPLINHNKKELYWLLSHN